MAVAYSEDLRKRAVSLVKQGRKIEEAAELLGLGKITVYRWVSKDRKGESLTPKKDWQKGYGNKIPDLDALREFVEENKGMTATAMAEKWGDISAKTMCKWLKRAGFTRKKKAMGISNAMKKTVASTWKN